jgi:hypothetical protein
MKTIKHLIFIALIFSLISGNAQNDAQSKAIYDYLENTKIVTIKQISDNNLSAISDAKIYHADLAFDLENSGYGNSVNTAYFVKTKTENKSFKNVRDILSSDIFIKSLNGFSLKINEDAVLMQSVLLLFDNESFNDGFFKEDNRWVFVRKTFFERAELIIVSTDAKGTITAIEFKEEKHMPAYESTSAGESLESESIKTKISEKDSLEMLNYLTTGINYEFKIIEPIYPELKQISNADFYRIELSVSQSEGDESYSMTMENNLMAYQDQFYNTTSNENLLTSSLFSQSIKPDYVIANNSDATNFESILDNILPIYPGRETCKSHNKMADDMWAFTRDIAFDQAIGWLVQLNDKNQIIALTNGDISETNALRLRMQDPNYTVDYGFQLNFPKTTDITVKEGDKLEIEIEFNEMPVNASGAWIMTRFNGKKVGMMASTQMESPFYETVPPQALTKGKHVLEYLLLNPGNDTANPLGHVTLNIIVN